VAESKDILSMLVSAGVALSEVDELESLLDLISETALNIGGCEGCSIYEATDNCKELRFLKTRNRALEARHAMPPFKTFQIPVTVNTIAGYAAVIKKPVNISDVYHLPSDATYTFNPAFDRMTGYHSKSILAIPMCDTKGNLLGVLQLINRVENGRVCAFPNTVEPYLRALASQFGVVLRNARISEQLRRGRIETVKQFVKASEYHDSDTGGHIERMSRYSVLLYSALGFKEAECDVMALASMLHDVGKISIPDAVLKKPGKLTPEEFEVMKRHTQLGYEMLRDAESPFLQMGAMIALGHHEKWDGAGYPRGLIGKDIPVEARVVALADVFDALCSRRCYKDSWPLEKVLDTLKESAGTHFDPELVELFFENSEEIYKIRNSFPVEAAPKTEAVAIHSEKNEAAPDGTGMAVTLPKSA
jgi:HD-GYP domain-containing protein (c-di-GMP phosphodiesterase class II)